MSRSVFIASLETDVTVVKSVAAISDLVQRFGARSFETVYSRTTGQPESIRFTVVDPNVAGEPEFTIQLAAPTERLRQALYDRAQREPDSDKLEARAARIAWRHLHDFVRASLIGVQDGLLTVGEAFLANLVVTRPDGTEQRFGDALESSGLLTPSNGRLLLGKGG